MRRRAFALIALLLGLGGFILLPFLAIGAVTTATPLATTRHVLPTSCTDKTPDAPHFYFLDRGKESAGAFGPSADLSNEDKVKAEFVRRLCGNETIGQDTVLVGVIGRLYLSIQPDAALVTYSPDSPRELADQLANGVIDWDRSHIVSATAPADALTLHMYGTNSKTPVVGVTPLRHRTSHFLKLYFKESSQPTLLRLPCGFQPIFTDSKEATSVVGP